MSTQMQRRRSSLTSAPSHGDAEGKPSLPTTVVVYQCKCGAWHIGDRAKSLNFKLRQSTSARKATQGKARR